MTVMGRVVPVWLKVVAVLGFLSLCMVMFFPCGCLGLTAWRRSVLTVRQVPQGCAVLQAPSAWVDQSNHLFNTHWAESDRTSYEKAAAMAPDTVRYAIRLMGASRLFRLAVPRAETRKSKNVFRQYGQVLLAASQADWDAAAQLPYDSPGELGAPLSVSGERSFDETRELAVQARYLTAMHSYSGPPLSQTTFNPVSLLPWVVQRSAFTNFYRFENENQMKNTAPLRVPPPPLEYLFCADEEGWMRRAAAWHGARVYTMPLSLDGRTFVVCEPQT